MPTRRDRAQPDAARAARLHRHGIIAGALSNLSDRQLHTTVEDAPVLESGIGGITKLSLVEGTPVFVKCVPLSDLERRPENFMSTANMFALPVGCHYGVGRSGSFGVWREVAANAMVTNWVLAGQSESFPLMHHWRVLERAASGAALPEELADTGSCTSKTEPPHIPWRR